MLHWKDERIRGHLCLCYIAYTLMNHLQLELKQADKPQTERHIRRSLNKMQVSLVQQGNSQFYMRSNMDAGQRDILNVLKIKKIPIFFVENTRRSLGYVCVFRLDYQQNLSIFIYDINYLKSYNSVRSNAIGYPVFGRSHFLQGYPPISPISAYLRYAPHTCLGFPLTPSLPTTQLPSH